MRLQERKDFIEFANMVKRRISEFLPEGETGNIMLEEVEKNNGVIYTSLLIKKSEKRASPNIYLEYYFDKFLRGDDLDTILSEIAEDYIESVSMVPKEIWDDYDFNKPPENIFLKVINYEKNKERLIGCPHICFHDLAVVCRYLVSTEKNGIASGEMRYRDMERWGINEEELWKAAKKKTRELFPVKFTRLHEMLKSIAGDNSCPEYVKLHVLTNKNGINGAVYMYYNDVLCDIAEELGCGFYILPSSIHELLLLPESESQDETLMKEMVRDVNHFVVDETDFLSDNVYYFDSSKKTIRILT